MSDDEFLAISPVALDALLMHAGRARLFPAAMVCAAIHNVNNDWKANPEGFTPQDFLPGAKTREERDAEDMREFVLSVERGETFDEDREVVNGFVAQVKDYFTPKAKT